MTAISINDFDKLKNSGLYNKLMSEAKDNKITNEQDAFDFVNKNFSREQAEKFKNLVKDKDKINTLLSSKEAKELMKLILEGEKNE